MDVSVDAAAFTWVEAGVVPWLSVIVVDGYKLSMLNSLFAMYILLIKTSDK